jgi:hypothetical protein
MAQSHRAPNRPWPLTEIQLLRFPTVIGLVWSHVWKVVDRSREHSTFVGESIDKDHDMLFHHVVDPGPFRLHSVSLPCLHRRR